MSAGFPMSQLSSNEDLVLHLKPHWIAAIKPVGEAVLIVIGFVLTWLFLPARWGDWPYVVSLLVAVALLAIFPIRPFMTWATTHIVVTTQRVIRKSRWIGLDWIEISLDKITDVHFTQSVLERAVHAGDIRIESAGRSGQEVFVDLPNPARIQQLLTELRPRASGRGAPFSVADELTKLVRLHEDGILTSEEFDLVKRRVLARA
jgi:uncharacterized membrane protein YdbT with pleckstrin-like domain